MLPSGRNILRLKNTWLDSLNCSKGVRNLSFRNAIDNLIKIMSNILRNKEQATKHVNEGDVKGKGKQQNEDRNIKEKNIQQDNTPGYIDISVVGTGSKGSPMAVLLKFSAVRLVLQVEKSMPRCFKYSVSV